MMRIQLRELDNDAHLGDYQAPHAPRAGEIVRVTDIRGGVGTWIVRLVAYHVLEPFACESAFVWVERMTDVWPPRL